MQTFIIFFSLFITLLPVPEWQGERREIYAIVKRHSLAWYDTFKIVGESLFYTDPSRSRRRYG